MKKFLHTTIQPSQKILHSIPICTSGENQEFLLIFRNYVQHLKYGLRRSKPTISLLAKYPIDVRISRICQFGELVAALTADAQAIFFAPSMPLHQIFACQLTNKISPSQIPIAHISNSINNNFLICCGLTKNCFIIQIVEGELKRKQIEIPDDIFVLGIVQSNLDHIFAFLIRKPNDEKLIIYVDISGESFQIIKEISVPNDTYQIISIKQGGSLFYFTNSSLHVIDNDFSLQMSHVTTYIHLTPSYLLIQNIQGETYGINTDNFSLSVHGALPVSSHFTLLSQNLLLSVSESGGSYIFTLPSDNLDFQFANLMNLVIPLSPRLRAALFDHNHIITASGMGTQSVLTQITNTLPFHSETIAQIDLEQFDISTIKLFAVNNETFVISDSEHSAVLVGYCDSICTTSPTLLIKCIQDRIVQICRDRITSFPISHPKEEDIITYTAPNRITCCDIGGDFIFISVDNEDHKHIHSIVMKPDLSVVADKEIGSVFDATFCEDYLAIATKCDGNDHSALSLYTIDLNPGESEIHLTSSITFMTFTSQELYVATNDGYVYNFEVNSTDSDFSSTKAEIFKGEEKPNIYSFATTILVLQSSSLFIYNGQQFLVLTPTDVPPATVASLEENLFIIDKNGQVTMVKIQDNDRDITQKSIQANATIRKISKYGDVFIALSRSENNIDSISVFSLNNEQMQKFDFDENIELLSLYVVPQSTQFMVGCKRTIKNAKNESDTDYYIDVMTFDSQFKLNSLQQIQCDEAPKAFGYFNGSIFLGINRHIYCLIYQEDGPEPKWHLNIDERYSSLPTGCSFVEIYDDVVWIVDGTQSLFCFICKQSPDDGLYTLRPAATDTKPKQLTAICVLNRAMVATGDKFGTIEILRLPDDVVCDRKWRVTQPPERDIYMPKTGILISLASFNIGEAVTSIFRNGRNNTLFYTSILGQIGALIPIKDEEASTTLQAASSTIKAGFEKEFALMKRKKFEHMDISVLDLDAIEQIYQLSDEVQSTLPIPQILGTLCRYKVFSKF